ncbi:MAG: glycosyltransferase family 2 protein [Deltaproteobacteria bacterium]|nr:MAG: glycosyltransferase family 2 protein [Deltaproteobacteria bacterium]
MTKLNLPPFYVITVNYYSGSYLPALISSLAPLPFLKKLIIVNHSPEEPLADLTAPFPLQIINQENTGYGAGLNRGLREIPENNAIALLCNPDLILAAPAAAAGALAYMEADPGVGCLIPKSVTFQGEFLYPGRAFYTWKTLLAARFSIFRRVFAKDYRKYLCLDGPPLSRPLEVDWGYGAAMFYRVSAFDRGPAFDTRFFLYMEDVDLCARLWQSGLAVVYYPEVLFRHHSQRESRSRWRFLFYHLASLLKFVSKYRGLPQREDLQRLKAP